MSDVVNLNTLTKENIHTHSFVLRDIVLIGTIKTKSFNVSMVHNRL